MLRSIVSRLLTLLSLLMALAGCGVAASEDGTGSESGDPGTTPTAGTPIDTDTLVTIDRSLCFGPCPSYSLSIAGDGTVAYQGRSYVNVKGPASAQVASSDVQGLVDRLLGAKYFNLSVPVDCPAGISTDAPSVTTSLALSGLTHTVQDYRGNPCVPPVLSSLEDAIDAVANSARWVKCGAPDGYCEP
jgi:hypothetical protein